MLGKGSFKILSRQKSCASGDVIGWLLLFTSRSYVRKGTSRSRPRTDLKKGRGLMTVANEEGEFLFLSPVAAV